MSVEVSAAETGQGRPHIEVRNSDLGVTSPVLTFTQAQWEAFVEGVKKGEFDSFPLNMRVAH